MKLTDIYSITESGDTRADKITWSLIGHVHVGDFVEAGVQYRIRLVQIKPEMLRGSSIANKIIYNIQFGVNDGSVTGVHAGATGINNSVRVLGIVQSESIIKLSRQYFKPGIISVSISENPRDNTEKQVQSRTNLYTRFLRSNGAKHGYSFIYPNIKVDHETIIAVSRTEITPDDIQSFSTLMRSRGK